MAPERSWLRVAGAIAGLLLAMACFAAGSKKKEELFLSQLITVLPGSYDNLAQSRADGADHPALRLIIAPVEAPLVGEHVYYVQEMAANDVRRVLAQSLYVLNPVTKKEQATLTQLEFKEPARWRDGHLNRDLFRGMLVDDLRARPGCDLLWERDGNGFKAAVGSGCRASSRDTGETLRVEQRMQLGPEVLAIFEQHRDAAGTLVFGAAADPWFRYIRRADAPW
ncbi:MAG TPA: chromophore lyase CpcT/CpeT [Steroidobacteraceae bacterium]|nr:chromophore lyase CpcT/CpeT [Steroidobacteraceae bacterium]